MSLLKFFRRNAEQNKEDEEVEEYEVAVFTPLVISMTNDLARRRREEELWSKYCRSSTPSA